MGDPEASTSTSIRRRGILSLIDGVLQRYDHDAELLLHSTTVMRNKRKRRTAPPESAATTTTTRRQREEYNPLHSEWTLFFVGASDSLNSIRFRPILVDFCNNHPDKVQCICVSNIPSDDRLLLTGTGFYGLPFLHPNRSALLQLLGLTQVPVVAVVSNKDGRRITDQGMAAIESNSNDAALLFERWRKRESGLTMLQWTTEACVMS